MIIAKIETPKGIILVEEIQSDDYPEVRMYLNDTMISSLMYSYETMEFDGELIDSKKFEELLKGENQEKNYALFEKCSFGTYQGKPIEWDILDRKENLLLLLASNGNIEEAGRAYEEDSYYSKKYVADWSNSSARSWLNSDFLELVFTDEEKNKIVTTTVVTGDQVSSDKVFLLSKEEIEKYLPNNESRMLVQWVESWGRDRISRWWTRTSASKSNIMEVGEDGEISKMTPDFPDGYLRMAMWVNDVE